MSKNREKIRSLIFYEFKQGHNATEASRNICETLGSKSVNERTWRRWYEKFCSEATQLGDKKRSGRPSTFNDTALLNAIEANPTETNRKLTQYFGTSQSTVNRHLHKIGKKISHTQTEPYELSEMQKNNLKLICQ